jgi:uncharacterized protein (DUF2164 family)
MINYYNQLLENNKNWVKEKLRDMSKIWGVMLICNQKRGWITS